MKNNILLFVFLFSLLYSCEKEFNIEQQFNKKINLICLIKADDTIRARVSFTTKSYLIDYPDYISNAEILLYEDGIFKEKLIYDTILDKYGFWGYYKSKYFFPSQNKTYQIKLYLPGFDTVYAETNIPEAIKIDSLSSSNYIKFDISSQDSMLFSNISISFKDKPSIKNYFNLKTNFTFKTSDPILEAKNNDGIFYSFSTHGEDAKQAFFTDSLFKNKSYSLILNYDTYLDNFKNKDSLQLSVDLISLSKDAYLYYKTTYLYGKTFENPLTEPVQIYSNVKNGTGIFAGYSSYSDTLVITKEMLNLK